MLSENSSLYSKPPAAAVTLENPTGSGPRFVKDLKAERTAKPQTLGIGSTFSFFTLDANGNHYVLIAIKGRPRVALYGYEQERRRRRFWGPRR